MKTAAELMTERLKEQIRKRSKPFVDRKAYRNDEPDRSPLPCGQLRKREDCLDCSRGCG
jgi:hypothetical protein